MPNERAKPLWEILMWRLFGAAENHGNESEPDHESGDLREIAAAAWRQLTDEQAQAVYEGCSDIMEAWGDPEYTLGEQPTSDLETRLERSKDATEALALANDGLCDAEQQKAVRRLVALSLRRENSIPDAFFEEKKAELEYRAELYRLEESLIRRASVQEATAIVRVEMKKLKDHQQLDVIFSLIDPFPLAEACLEKMPADHRVSLFRNRYCAYCGEVDHHGTCSCRDED